jgi:putative protease
MRAENFTEAELPKLLEYLHKRGVKGYVTLNTLVFQDELAEAERYVRSMIAAGVDAVIVQDIGICRLIRQLSPDLPIHASTQMTITSPGGLAFARQLGCNLVVLARECSLKEIEKIRVAGADAEHGGGRAEMRGAAAAKEGRLSIAGEQAEGQLPIEVFVHGALCVAYSGQCLTSEALGGRSANRGECAQACRMPYELIADGQKVDLGARKYLLSPQDLAGLEVLPELVRLGVASLKIEGRLKSPEYVANITRIYRRALEQAARNVNGSSGTYIVAEQSRYDLEMAFSRGLYTGWFEGIDNQKLVHGRFGKKRGVYLGQVRRVVEGSVELELEAPLSPGDGVVFAAGTPEKEEEGGRVYEVDKHGRNARLSFGREAINFRKLHVGDKVWKTSDPALERRLRQSFAGDKPRHLRPVDIEVHGRAGTTLTVVVRDEMGHVVQVSSTMALVQAQAQPLTEARLCEHLGRLGGTGFRLGELRNELEGHVILPVSELNRLRREWVGQLEILRSKPPRWTLNACERRINRGVEEGRESAAGVVQTSAEPELIVLVRSMGQLTAALEGGAKILYCEFEDPKKYRDAVAQFRAWQRDSRLGEFRSDGDISKAESPDVSTLTASQVPQADVRRAIYVAPPRIHKAGEEWILKQVRSSEADGYLVRNYDHLRYFADCRCVGDYSLNIANALTAEYFKAHYKLERLTASYDLNDAQLEALLDKAPGEWFEVTIHQHMPMFHMEHCVFCAFLSKGTDYTNCGRPCDKHQVELEDRVGAKHPVKADVGCRNTVFNGVAQSGAEHVAKLRQRGVRYFRIEFLNEEPGLVKQTIAHYQALLAGRISGPAVWRELNLINQLGVTRGAAVRR